MTREDLVAIGLEAVWKVLEEQPEAANSFIDQKLRWVMTDAIRHWVPGHQKPIPITSLDDPDFPQLFDPKTTPDGKAIKKQKFDLLREAIQKLPEREQEVVCRRLEGDQMEDIAKDLGVTPGRVTQILTEAVARLKELLNPEG